MNRMKKIGIILFLLVVTVISAQKVNRISSEPTEKHELKADDELISTLGYFKAVLDQKNCQLGVYQFSQTEKKYLFVESYQPSQVSTCQSIKIDKNKLLTDTGIQLAKLSSPDFSKTWLTIDDQGSIRLIGVKPGNSQGPIPQSEEIVLKSIPAQKQNYKNIVSDSHFKLGQVNQKYTNSDKWVFELGNNGLTISKESNANLRKKFSLENVNLDRAGIYDEKNQAPPFAIFDKVLGFPRCNIRKTACQVRAPYTIEFNEQWPVVRIYDQEKYLIAQYSMGQVNNFAKTHICPPGSFLLGSLCLKECPAPYYEKIDGVYGQCVLTCEEGSIINEDQMVCSCSALDLTSNGGDTKNIKKCQRQWKATFYGCDCSPIGLVYDRLNSLTCQKTCPARTFTDSGVCYECPSNCLTCTRDNQFIQYLKCDSCAQGFKLQNNVCVKQTGNCPANCQECKGSQCTRCSSFYSLYEGNCVFSCPPGYFETYQFNKGSYCAPNGQSDNSSSCYVGCLKCDGQNCLVCAPGYVLFVSPFASTCKLKGPTIKCPENYVYDSFREICYIDNTEGTNMAKCKSQIPHCQACQTNSDNVCLLCEPGYLLHNNACVQKCPSGFLKVNNVCIEQIKDCQTQGSDVYEEQGTVNSELIKNSRSYKRQIYNGLEPSNDPQGYDIYFKEFILQQDTGNTSYPTIARSSQSICLKCRRGYGLSDDQTKCLPCPSTCQYQHCYFARQNSCYKPTIRCTYLDENDNCMQSCPDGRFPEVDAKNETRCLLQTKSSVNDYLKIDSSYYLQDDGSKIYYFVLDKPVENGTVKLSNKLLSLNKERIQENAQVRLLVQSADVISLQQGQYYGVRNTKENAVAISFEDNVNKFRTPFGFTLANSVYGAQADYTHNQWMKQWLAHIGYVLSWVILIIHCLYVGNTILYKADNLIIFCQTIYFFTFVKLLVGNTLAQYYYGWFWMHMGFWPNYFKHTIPSQYEQKEAPVSFKLSTLDGNFIRNAGFAVSLFLTFLAGWIIINLIVFLLHKLLKKNDIWYTRVAKNTLIAAVELLSMVIFFFSVTQLIYGGDYPEKDRSFHRANFAAAIFFVTAISIYMFVRCFFNLIGGLYMFKRLAVALILVNAYQVEGFLALLIALEVVLLLIRYLIEKPRMLREKVYMLVETILFIIAYFLLFLVRVPGVNVLIITVIIFVLLLFLIADLMDVYLESRNEYYEFDFLGAKYDNQETQEHENLPDSERKMNS